MRQIMRISTTDAQVVARRKLNFKSSGLVK
jgi:hypothetical protein